MENKKKKIKPSENFSTYLLITTILYVNFEIDEIICYE